VWGQARSAERQRLSHNARSHFAFGQRGEETARRATAKSAGKAVCCGPRGPSQAGFSNVEIRRRIGREILGNTEFPKASICCSFPCPFLIAVPISVTKQLDFRRQNYASLHLVHFLCAGPPVPFSRVYYVCPNRPQASR
jgi:hypothetical protein